MIYLEIHCVCFTLGTRPDQLMLAKLPNAATRRVCATAVDMYLGRGCVTRRPTGLPKCVARLGDEHMFVFDQALRFKVLATLRLLSLIMFNRSFLKLGWDTGPLVQGTTCFPTWNCMKRYIKLSSRTFALTCVVTVYLYSTVSARWRGMQSDNGVPSAKVMRKRSARLGFLGF